MAVYWPFGTLTFGMIQFLWCERDCFQLRPPHFCKFVLLFTNGKGT